MVWVMVSGGIDLSAGAVLGFLANFAAVLQTQHNLGTTPTILFTLIIGTLIGCWNGYWIAYRRIPAFIATLAGQLIFKGLTLLIGEGKAQGPVSDSFAQMGRGFLLNSASIIFVVLTMCLFVAYTLKKRLSQKSYGLPVLSVRLESFKIVVVVGLSILLLVVLLEEFPMQSCCCSYWLPCLHFYHRVRRLAAAFMPWGVTEMRRGWRASIFPAQR